MNFDGTVNVGFFCFFFPGRLIITNVERGDYQNGRAYACMAMNTFVRTNTQGAEHYITPTGCKFYY